jgi:hypothetical protein
MDTKTALLLKVATKAQGLVRTSGVHWESAEIQVVEQWWDSMVAALDEAEDAGVFE